MVADHIHLVEDTATDHVRDCGPEAHLVEEKDPTEHKTTVKTRVVVPGYLQIADKKRLRKNTLASDTLQLDRKTHLES